MSKRNMQSLSESVVIAFRMAKWLAAEEIYRSEKFSLRYLGGRDPYDDFADEPEEMHDVSKRYRHHYLDGDLDEQDMKKIGKICERLDIRQMDVVRITEHSKSKRTIFVKFIFGRNVNAMEDYVALGTCVLTKDLGGRWDPVKKMPYEGLCWGTDTGSVALTFPDGEILHGLETDFDGAQSSLPTL